MNNMGVVPRGTTPISIHLYPYMKKPIMNYPEMLDFFRDVWYNRTMERGCGKPQRKPAESEYIMAKMYIESDNGGRSIVLNNGALWFICECAPNGCFGGVDFLHGTVYDAAHRIRAAIESGELCDADECAEYVADLSEWRIIPDWQALGAREIECVENAGYSCDLMTLTEI